MTELPPCTATPHGLATTGHPKETVLQPFGPYLRITMMDAFRKRERAEDMGQEEQPSSLRTPVSPPRKSRRLEVAHWKSPWQLTRIRDLPEHVNRDAVSLKDILGDPLITECWEFNYLHDISFLMDAFDPDTRHLVDVHVVHGFWKQEDLNRATISVEAARHGNVKLHVAPMPEMFGTHHSKMIILFRNDETAQVIIHTANMIAKDWTNMTNAVWRSPRLPKMDDETEKAALPKDYADLRIGGGERFKADLVNYLRSYDRRKVTCGPLADKISHHDFSAVNAALIASVPGKHPTNDLSKTAFGWAAIQRCLQTVRCKPSVSEIVIQVSSIATLGANDTWLQKTLFESLKTCKDEPAQRPVFKIIFPTADEIRESLDGYSSGGSIHTKIQSPQQVQQLRYLRPMLHHWANDSRNGISLPPESRMKNGGRNRAAPHIKTYIRYNNVNSIDWALLTSANLSKQAWGGESVKSTGETRIASWEIGVLLWPALFGSNASMVGTFQSDFPGGDDSANETGADLIGLRIAYSLPLQRYSQEEIPWVASNNHPEPDCFGQKWM
ncbi:uncharacterized protein UV8b_01444 [Ustilaginoidea virens]|uniref:Tyrosyl-DNA phosphodiesterase n=1 Tax=Ustilaginoidea virens TaxID=1159556 RepID=A0A8E5HL09_USTVR|nr:uncharacterized protein UV8b_01444 [Ustilaginoidea virens]QUC17203.1 hypothetical protein UV8b_01444 [Ustilaginoidea virens]